MRSSNHVRNVIKSFLTKVYIDEFTLNPNSIPQSVSAPVTQCPSHSVLVTIITPVSCPCEWAYRKFIIFTLLFAGASVILWCYTSARQVVHRLLLSLDMLSPVLPPA